MMYLLSDAGKTLLESLCFTETLFAFDFDGTLSKIAATPEKATVPKQTETLLTQLNNLAQVAVISGRGLEDLRAKVNLTGGYLVGNHGLEGIGKTVADHDRYQRACDAWRTHFERALSGRGKFKALGVELEDKHFSIALHYRKSRQKNAARNAILKSLSGLSPSPRIILGKCVVNLVPAGGPHKGIALLELMVKAGVKSAFYIGDDDTDEDVFALPNSGIFTVRVGKKVSSQAKYFIRDQSEINLLLKTLVNFFEDHSNDAMRK